MTQDEAIKNAINRLPGVCGNCVHLDIDLRIMPEKYHIQHYLTCLRGRTMTEFVCPEQKRP